MSKQNQRGGDNSTNFQAEQIIVVQQGPSLAEVRQVAIEVFKENFLQGKGKARETAEQRGEEITEKFLGELQKQNPEGLSKAEDPDFQDAMFNVQKEYARTGDKDLGDLLVDMLVDRSKCKQRDILQIVLNESLTTAPKLTNDQLSALAIIFLARYTVNLGVHSLEALGTYLDRHFAPFVDSLSTSPTCFTHLEFSGCGTIGIGQMLLEACLGRVYQGLFVSGFPEAEITNRGLSFGKDSEYFIPSVNDPTMLQVRGLNQEELERHVNNLSQDDKAKLIGLFNHGKFTDPAIRQKVIETRPYMEKAFDVWASTNMKYFSLTSVGMAIGHANVKRLVGEFANLSIWIR